MKIALCLHGLFNSTQDLTSKGMDGFDYINRNILSKFDVDVFVHSWEIDKLELINNLYNPKLYKYEHQKDFSKLIIDRHLNTLMNCPRTPFNVLSHFYSVSESIKLPFLLSNVSYDIIIKSRFDLGRINRNTTFPGSQNSYPVQCINLKNKIDVDKIYMANWNHFNMGPADMWFYGSPQIMKNFTTLYDILNKEMYINSDFHKFAISIENNEGDLSNSIAFYKWWMIKNDLWNKKEPLNTIFE